MMQTLPAECKDLKPYLTTKSAEQIFLPKTDFLKWVETARTKANDLYRLREFTDVKLPIISKKGLHVNTSGLKKENTDAETEFQEEWKKLKKIMLVTMPEKQEWLW